VHQTQGTVALFISGALGLVVLAAFPVAPPRFLAGFTDTVRLARQDHLAHPSAITNQHAAMPSFHVGWTVLAGAWLVPLVTRPVLRVVPLVPGVLIASPWSSPRTTSCSTPWRGSWPRSPVSPSRPGPDGSPCPR
jgi:hypothetical protein